MIYLWVFLAVYWAGFVLTLWLVLKAWKQSRAAYPKSDPFSQFVQGVLAVVVVSVWPATLFVLWMLWMTDPPEPARPGDTT